MSDQWTIKDADAIYLGLEDISQKTGRLLSRQDKMPESNKLRFKAGDILFAKLRPNLNKGWVAEFDGICSTDFIVLRLTEENAVIAKFLLAYLQNIDTNILLVNAISGARLPRVSTNQILGIEIPVPKIATQKQLVSEMEEQEDIINANKKLIRIMEKKIDEVLAGL